MRRHALLVLGVLLGLLALGRAIRVEAGEAQLAGWSGPGCLVSDHLGENACPGCGLTRASALTLQGDWRGAMDFHLGGIVLVGVFLFWAGLYAWMAWQGRLTTSMRRAVRLGRYVLILGVGIGWYLRIG